MGNCIRIILTKNINGHFSLGPSLRIEPKIHGAFNLSCAYMATTHKPHSGPTLIGQKKRFKKHHHHHRHHHEKDPKASINPRNWDPHIENSFAKAPPF